MSYEGSANFSRVVALVITTGSDLLRKILLKQIPPNKGLGQFLKDKRQTLDVQKKKKVLTDPQFHLVTARDPDEEKFDISLLVTLLRSICSIGVPVQGWNQVPPDHNDVSIAADLLRLRDVRNRVIAHAPVSCLATTEFKDIWKNVEAVLTRLATHAGIKEDVVTKQIAYAKMRPLDPTTQLEHVWDPFIKWYREDVQSLQGQLTELSASYESQQSNLSSLQNQDWRPVRILIRLLFQGWDFIFRHRDDSIQTNVSSLRDEVASLRQEMKSVIPPTTDIHAQVRGRAQSEDQEIRASLKYMTTVVSVAMKLIEAQNRISTKLAERTDEPDGRLPIMIVALKTNDDTLTQFDAGLDYIMQSVGILVGPNNFGTCFRVGTKYIMTAWHVVGGIVDPTGSLHSDFAKLEADTVYINFNEDPTQPCDNRFRVKKDICFRDENLDVAVLELVDTTNAPPPLPLCKIQTEPDHISFIGFGHPDSKKKHLDPKCIVLSPMSDNVKNAHEWLYHHRNYLKGALETQSKDPELVSQGYVNYDNPNKVLFHCFMQKGASGAPGIILNPDSQQTEVVCVLTNGSPVCYWELPAIAKSVFPAECRIEMGTKIGSLAVAMNDPKYHSLRADIF